MAFHDVRFPTDLSRGSSGGPERFTEIVTLANGFEERNSPWESSRRRYDAGLGVRSLDEVELLIAFFEARRGRLHGFRWKDWADWRSCPTSHAISAVDQSIGTGDGTTTMFRLCKHYASGSESYTRLLDKPVTGSVQVAVGGSETVEEVDWTLDAATGTVTFAIAPVAGAPVTAGCEFDVPVRFDTDRLDISYSAFAAGDVPSVPVVEIRV
ncbi:MAG: DUF2460 domain-containing protein [Pseudomonadota bacterium]